VPPALVHRTATLPVRPDGTLRLAAVADTHSLPHAEAARRLAAVAPDAILHGGDIGELEVLDRLAEIAPVHAVRGNIDARTDAREIPDALTLEITRDGRAVLRIFLIHIAVAGPRIRAEVARRARAAGATLIVCGHSHVPFLGADRGLTVFNPGSIGPRRFSLPIVFGTIDLAPGGVRFAHVDVETGRDWQPPAAARA
jgi:putative phosphoesterase